MILINAPKNILNLNPVPCRSGQIRQRLIGEKPPAAGEKKGIMIALDHVRVQRWPISIVIGFQQSHYSYDTLHSPWSRARAALYIN